MRYYYYITSEEAYFNQYQHDYSLGSTKIDDGAAVNRVIGEAEDLISGSGDNLQESLDKLGALDLDSLSETLRKLNGLDLDGLGETLKKLDGVDLDSLNDAIRKLNGVDLESLNEAIVNLNDAAKPLADLARRLGGG